MSNIIPFRAPARLADAPVSKCGTASLAARAELDNLSHTLLQALFTTIDCLDRALDRTEARYAALPPGPLRQGLEKERTRLACELFEARMRVVRISFGVAPSAQQPAGREVAGAPD